MHRQNCMEVGGTSALPLFRQFLIFFIKTKEHLLLRINFVNVKGRNCFCFSHVTTRGKGARASILLNGVYSFPKNYSLGNSSRLLQEIES